MARPWLSWLLSTAESKSGFDCWPEARPSSSLIYFTPNPSLAEPGTIWELSALGGVARKVASAMSGADISHDGQRIALFQLRGADLALITISLDGTMLHEIKRF